MLCETCWDRLSHISDILCIHGGVANIAGQKGDFKVVPYIRNLYSERLMLLCYQPSCDHFSVK